MDQSPERASVSKSDRKERSFSVKAIALGLTVLLVWALLLITLFYSVDYRALSPVGLLVVLITLGLVALYAYRRFSPAKKSYLGLASLVLLQISPVSYPSPYDVTGWDIMADNFVMSATVDAWAASFEIDPTLGIPGFTPLFFRVAVPYHPVTLILNVPRYDTVEAVGIISGQHKLFFENSPAILNTLPQHSLVAHDLLITIPSGFYGDPQLVADVLLPSLKGACAGNCLENISMEVNPEYAALLAIDAAQALATAVKLPRAAARSLDLVDMAADLYLDPEWNIRESIFSHGTAHMAGSEFTWFSHTDRVYAGSILAGSWSISESSRTMVHQQYGVSQAVPEIPAFVQSNRSGISGMELIEPFELPVFEPPAIQMNPFELPVFEPPDIQLNPIEIPVYEPPDIQMDPIELPVFELPDAPRVDIPDFDLPSFELPSNLP